VIRQLAANSGKTFGLIIFTQELLRLQASLLTVLILHYVKATFGMLQKTAMTLIQAITLMIHTVVQNTLLKMLLQEILYTSIQELTKKYFRLQFQQV
jgi:hypothetical protein